MIIVENLSLEIKGKLLLNNINAAFEDGKIHGLIGRNGSGKTMLMKCICGFIKPTAGHVMVDEKVVGKDVDFPGHTGIIIETPGFIPYYSGYKNLKLLADLNGEIGKDRIESVMEQVGLDPHNRLTVGKYSLGMRQRLGIAQAIMENPRLLVLDEPFNSLDEEGVAEMRKILSGLREKGTTIILASHSAEDISVLCDTVYKMERGELRKIRE